MRFAHDYLDNQEVKSEKHFLPPTSYFLLIGCERKTRPPSYLLTSHSYLLTIYKSVREADTTISHFSFLISNFQKLLTPPSYLLTPTRLRACCLPEGELIPVEGSELMRSAFDGLTAAEG